MEQAIQNRINDWLSKDYDEAARREIQDLIDKKDEKELMDRFYMELEFGTGGLRGTLGAGSNRMNVYNVRKATQGLANYIIQKGGQNKGVVVGRDPRNGSNEFAQNTAAVFAANGIKVYYFDDIHPTPSVSHAIRYFKAISGVMVTASHNPKEYNGYKVFWDNGCQVTAPADEEIIAEARKITSNSQVKLMTFADAKAKGMITIIDAEIDPIFLKEAKSVSIHPEAAGSSLKICYSPLYGAGYKLVPASFRNYGFKDITMVTEQSTPNGNFPTAPYPNPEEPEAMALGMKTAQEIKADVFIATDPDADRIGAMLKREDGTYALLNGNQIAVLLFYYIASEKQTAGSMPKMPQLVTTIVTTPLMFEIAKKYGVIADEVLTGFKWIGLQMDKGITEGKNYIFGCEESHGYLPGLYARDKDAVTSASLFAEMTAYYKMKGRSAFSVLLDIYREFGYYHETQKSVTMKGADGAVQIKALMEKIRTNPPKTIGSYKVLTLTDVKTGDIFDAQTGKKTGKKDLPSSNVLVFNLEGNARVVARPSGTEPKIKFYFSTSGKPKGNESSDDLLSRVMTEHADIKEAFLKELGL